MDYETELQARLNAMAERYRQRANKAPAVEDGLQEEHQGDEMINEFDGVKVRPRGLTVFGDTGALGGEAVAVMPRLPGEPDPASYLDSIAQAEWHRMIEILRNLNILSPAYGPALAIYCQSYSRMCEAEEQIAQHGMVNIRRHGIVVQSPYVAIAKSASQICLKVLATFGLDPTSARNVATPPVVDDLEVFLSKHA